MLKDALTDLHVDYEGSRMSFSYDAMSTTFQMSMQFDEFPKPIEKLKLKDIHDAAWKKLNKKLKCYLD